MEINYIDVLITRAVLLEDIGCVEELNKIIPAKYQLNHFLTQNDIFIPYLYYIVNSNLKYEDLKKAKKRLKKNLNKNLSLLNIIKDTIIKLNLIEAEPVISTTFSSFLYEIHDLKQFCFDQTTIIVRADKLQQSVKALKELNWQTSDDLKFKIFDNNQIKLSSNTINLSDFDFNCLQMNLHLADLPVKVICPTLSLYFHCLDAKLRVNNSWIYHAVKLISKFEIDWQLIIKLCEQFDYCHTVNDIFNFLIENYSVVIPENILLRLKEKPVSLAEKFEIKSLNVEKFGFKEHFNIIIADFLRTKKAKQISYLDFPKFVFENTN